MRVGSSSLAVLVLALPFVAFVLLAGMAPLRRAGRPAGLLSIGAVGLALVAAVGTWLTAAVHPRGVTESGPLEPSTLWPWIPADGGPMVTVGVMVDELSMAMLILVALVSFLVQLYSLAYLDAESAPSLGRYYTYQSLFAFSMLGLVLSPTFIQMFVFWELVGLCSYLLIGFWYDRPAAARAAVKAFWVTKLGDVGFIVGILMLWGVTGTFEFSTLFQLAQKRQIPLPELETIMFLIYLGAVGKSAQFPLHVWLPDAMEGPTPVSALIHAATMVTAGVFMVTRAMPLFGLVPDVLHLMAWVGALTALLAATMACVEGDIKRVLAYSTVSQLGYMMAAAGAGAADAGFSHLLTHGLFKALLFLGAGAVIHAVGTNDIFRMGQLARAMPVTAGTFIAGTLALAGVWPLAGFFSKEAVLAGVWEGDLPGAFLMLALTAFLTAFYMFRVVFLVFFGRAHAGAHPHEAPALMTIPLWVLTALTVVVGLAGATHLIAVGGEHHGPPGLARLSLGLAAAGIALAWLVYQRSWINPRWLAIALAPLDFLARRRYGLDALYVGLYRAAILGFSRLIGWIDRYLVDGLLNVATALTLQTGDRVRRIQSGRAQDYVYGVAFGVLLLFVWAQWVRR